MELHLVSCILFKQAAVSETMASGLLGVYTLIFSYSKNRLPTV